MRRFALLVVVLLGAACASAEKRVEQGQEAEQEGRWAEATQRYLDALRKDPEYPGARDKATKAGNRAVADYLETAKGLEAGGQYDRAVTEYRRVDSLRTTCSALRVVLTVPRDYDQRRRGTFQRAYDSTADAAQAALEAGNWGAALDLYRRADSQFEPDAARIQRSRDGRLAALIVGARAELEAGNEDQAQQLASSALEIYGADSPRSKEARELKLLIVEARYRSLLDQTRAAMARGSYQQAYGIVASAIGVHGEESPASEEARLLRDEILEKGTVHVAVATVWRTEELGDQAPPELMDRIHESLAAGHWVNPPLFVSVTDPDSVRSEMRRLDYHRELLSNVRAAALGQQLGVDLVAVPYLVKCRFWARGKPMTQVVPTTKGTQATILVHRERRLTVRCAYDLISVATKERVGHGYVDSETRSPHDWATFDGDPRKLRLTPDEHAWFDADTLADVDAKLFQTIATDMAPALAASIYEAVTKRLP